MHEAFKRLRIVEKQPVVEHGLIIVSERPKRLSVRYGTQFAVDRCMIVDGVAVPVLLGEEGRLVRSYSLGKGTILQGGVRNSGAIQAGKIVPMACISFRAPELSALAIDVDGGRLFPEGPLGVHDAWHGGGEQNAFHDRCRITRNVTLIRRLSCRSRPEFDKDGRTDIAGACRDGSIVDRHGVFVPSYQRIETVRLKMAL